MGVLRHPNAIDRLLRDSQSNRCCKEDSFHRSVDRDSMTKKHRSRLNHLTYWMTTKRKKSWSSAKTSLRQCRRLNLLLPNEWVSSLTMRRLKATNAWLRASTSSKSRNSVLRALYLTFSPMLLTLIVSQKASVWLTSRRRSSHLSSRWRRLHQGRRMASSRLALIAASWS